MGRGGFGKEGLVWGGRGQRRRWGGEGRGCATNPTDNLGKMSDILRYIGSRGRLHSCSLRFLSGCRLSLYPLCSNFPLIILAAVFSSTFVLQVLFLVPLPLSFHTMFIFKVMLFPANYQLQYLKVHSFFKLPAPNRFHKALPLHNFIKHAFPLVKYCIPSRFNTVRLLSWISILFFEMQTLFASFTSIWQNFFPFYLLFVSPLENLATFFSLSFCLFF